MAYSLRQRLNDWKLHEPESELEPSCIPTTDALLQLEAWFATEGNMERIIHDLTIGISATLVAASRGESRSLLGLITAYFVEAPKTRSAATGVEIARWCQAQPDCEEMDEADVDSLAGVLIDEAQEHGLIKVAGTVCLICRPRRP